MSHDRGCFRCFEDHPTWRAEKGICKLPDCPYKEEPMIDGTLKTKTPPRMLDASGTTPKKLKLSWSTINDAVETLAYMVRPYSPNLIVGVSRGGLIPATLLSHKLNIPLSVISVSAYDGMHRTDKPPVVEGWDPRYDSTKTLVVDDILDSGDTLETIRFKTGSSYNHNFNYASLISKRPELNSRNMYFAHVPKDVWVQFPWEQDEQ